MNKNITLSLATLLIFSTAAMAEQAEVSDVEAQYSAKSTVNAGNELKQSINLGFSNTTGNAETLNVNGKFALSFTTIGLADQALKVGFDASAFLTETDNIKNNEEYTANLGLEQYVMNDWLAYGSVNWLRNEFRNFDNKVSLGAGVGKELFNDGQHSLKLKIGAAYNIEQYTDGQEERTFTTINEYLEYNNKLNNTSSLYIKIGAAENIEDFQDDYEVMAVAGLNFAVAENLSVTIEEEVRYDNTAPTGFEDLDTKTIVRVGYTF